MTTRGLRRRRLGGWLLPIVLGVGLGEILYAGGANLFLSSSLGDGVINRRPERLRVTWERAWTVVPGLVHLRNLEIRGQDRKLQWYASIGRATVATKLTPLIARRFATHGAWVTGVELRVRRRADATRRPPSPSGPSIPGLANPPKPAPETLYPARRSRSRWSIALRRIAVRHLRSVWIDAHRLTGRGRADGELHLEVGGPLTVNRAAVAWREGTLRVGPAPTVEGLALDLDVSLSRFEPREQEGMSFLDHLSGTIDLGGRFSGLDFLAAHLSRLPSVDLDARGQVDAHLALASGELRPGSGARIKAEPVTARFFTFEASGDGTIDLRVTPGSGGRPRSLLAARIERYDLRRLAARTAHVAGRNLAVAVEAGTLRLGRPAEDLTARIELPPSEVHDVTFFEGYVPPGLGLRLVAGTGTLSGRFEASTDERAVRGHFDLVAEDLEARAEDTTLKGRLKLETRISGRGGRPYDASGSRLELTDFQLSEAGRAKVAGWKAEVELPRAALSVGEGSSDLHGVVRVRMTDTRPLVALLAEGKIVLEWFEALLSVPDVAAEADFRWRGRELTLHDLEAFGKGMEVIGDLTLSDGGRRGLLFLRLGKLSAAVEMKGEGRDWKLLHSRAWFERRRAARGGVAESVPSARGRGAPGAR